MIETFKMCKFINQHAKEVPFSECSIVLGILNNGWNLYYPISKDLFPQDTKINDKFILENEKLTPTS